MGMRQPGINLLTASLVCFYSASAFQIRLRDGGNSFIGRVEVNFEDGRGWGTVCRDYWNDDDAKVVCRSLNLEYRYAAAINDYYGGFGDGSGPILMDDVKCVGTESSLSDCPYDPDTSDCNYYRLGAGVLCLDIWIGGYIAGYIENPYSKIMSTLDGRLKLRDRRNRNYSISVCSENFGIEDARVACNELGYGRNRSVAFRVDDRTTENESLFRLEFNCTGSEHWLANCRKIYRFGYCPSNAPVAPWIACNYDKPDIMKFSQTSLELRKDERGVGDKFACRYDKSAYEEKVNEITVYGFKTTGNKLSLNIGDPFVINCETDYARPRPLVNWYLDNLPYHNFTYVQNETFVSNAKYKVKSTLTLTPAEEHHGQMLSCCSDDQVGYKICSQNYQLFVRIPPKVQTMKILYKKNSSNADMTLTCLSSRVRPRVDLKWYKNGDVVNNSAGLSVKTEHITLGADTFETKSMLTLTDVSSVKDGDFFQCEASYEDVREMLHVPIIVISGDSSRSQAAVSSDERNKSLTTGNVIAFLALGLGVVVLSSAVLYLIIRNRRKDQPQDHSRSSAHTPLPTITESFDNLAYTAHKEEVTREDYEQLQMQEKKKNATKHQEEVYENTTLPTKAKKKK